MVKLGHEMAAADEKKADELNQKMGELQKKLGPEYAALMDAFQDVDLGSEVGQEISSMFAALRQRDHPLRPRAQVPFWKGTHAFAKRQRELGDRFVARPAFTRKWATYIGLAPLDEHENASEEEPP